MRCVWSSKNLRNACSARLVPPVVPQACHSSSVFHCPVPGTWHTRILSFHLLHNVHNAMWAAVGRSVSSLGCKRLHGVWSHRTVASDGRSSMVHSARLTHPVLSGSTRHEQPMSMPRPPAVRRTRSPIRAPRHVQCLGATWPMVVRAVNVEIFGPPVVPPAEGCVALLLRLRRLQSPRSLHSFISIEQS